MAATATRKRKSTTKRKAAPVTTRIVYRQPEPVISLPDIGWRNFRWDPRITVYATPEEATVYSSHAAFTVQPRGPFDVEGFQFTELGAFHEDTGDKRIVMFKELG